MLNSWIKGESRRNVAGIFSFLNGDGKGESSRRRENRVGDGNKDSHSRSL